MPVSLASPRFGRARRLGLLAVSVALVAFPGALPAHALAEDPPAKAATPEMVSYWWMFFVSGDNKTPVSKEEAQQMQANHIANLERLGKGGKALFAGPFGDRGPYRG